MDPYLERHWRDVHQRLVIYACDALQPRLPGGLRARVEERVFVEAAPALGRSIYPYVRVIESRPEDPTAGGAAGIGVAIAEPLVIPLVDEPVSEGYVQIVDVSSGGRVVTVVEFLSPANKQPGEGQGLYLRKQKEVIDAGVSLVEVDLVRAGQPAIRVSPYRIPPSHRTLYQVCVSRGWRRDAAEVYRVPLQERLPTIGIPLREGDADVPLDLQELLDRGYANGGYDDIDYRQPPEPPLDPEHAVWADALLRATGLR